MIHYRCCSCGKQINTDSLIYRCPDCVGKEKPGEFQKGNLLIELSSEIKGRYKKGDIVDVFDFYPFPMDKTAAFPAGNTPLVLLDRLAEKYGLTHLWGKLEGANPSGSFKDRASLLVAAQAQYLGEKKIVLASTGNAGAAMSCAGAALGLDIILFVPASAPVEKLAQSLLYGAKVVPVKGTYDDAFRLSIEYSGQFRGINRNTAYNPATTEGKKSAAIEIYNQFNADIPDLVYIPAGDGVIYTGIAKGFEDLQKAGLIDQLPRCIAVQAESSNAISRSFKEKKTVILEKTDTMADSIAVCSPACGEPAVQYLEKCKGWSVEVSDREIRGAMAELAGEAGIFVEPSSAAAWAGMKKDIQFGNISGEERAVLMLTGLGFKDMKSALSRISLPEAIDPDLDSAAACLGAD